MFYFALFNKFLLDISQNQLADLDITLKTALTLFKDCINPALTLHLLCACSLEVKNTSHFFLHCLRYSTFRMGLRGKVNQIDEKFSY